uniref:Putative secreted protein n=1 Tax=Amblyomma aureolatum TaxID=187763 RepID=A0A1E1X1A3_9ACAR
MALAKMVILSILVASCLLIIVRRTNAKNIFGPDVFGNDGLCNGPCFIDEHYRSNCSSECTCITNSLNRGDNTGPGTCRSIN